MISYSKFETMTFHDENSNNSINKSNNNSVTSTSSSSSSSHFKQKEEEEEQEDTYTLVVVRCTGNLTWLEKEVPKDWRIIVYEKCTAEVKAQKSTIPMWSPYSVYPKVVGEAEECNGYLDYLVDYYHNLTSITIFMHDDGLLPYNTRYKGGRAHTPFSTFDELIHATKRYMYRPQVLVKPYYDPQEEKEDNSSTTNATSQSRRRLRGTTTTTTTTTSAVTKKKKTSSREREENTTTTTTNNNNNNATVMNRNATITTNSTSETATTGNTTNNNTTTNKTTTTQQTVLVEFLHFGVPTLYDTFGHDVIHSLGQIILWPYIRSGSEDPTTDDEDAYFPWLLEPPADDANDNIIYYKPNAHFAVTRNTIHKRTKSTYQAILQQMRYSREVNEIFREQSETEQEKFDVLDSRSMCCALERMWHMLFGLPPNLPYSSRVTDLLREEGYLNDYPFHEQ